MSEPTHGAPAASAVSRTRPALRILAVLFAFAAIYFSLAWLQIDRAQSEGEQIEKKTKETVLSLNAGIKVLRESPGSAPELEPQVKAIQESLDEVVPRLDRLRAGTQPPGVRARREYKDALRSYVSQVDGYASELSTITALAIARTETVQKVAEGFGQLEKLSEPGMTEDKLRGTLDGVKTAVDTAVKELRSMTASGTALYSNSALDARLSAISAVIDEILGALKDADQQRLNSAARGFAELMQSDWQSLFLRYDLKGLGQLSKDMRELSKHREAVDAAREKVTSAQQSAAAAAIVFFIAAAVSAFLGWHR